MGDITLRQIEAFIAVASCGSFSRAAEELFLNQSTVSTHIGELEHSLGVRLFIRGSRKVSMTEEGMLAYPLARKISEDCAELATMFGDAGQLLLLGASSVPGRYLLPGYMTQYIKQQPDCRYQLRLGDTEQVHELLKTGEIRIGFVGAMSDREGTEYYPLAEDRLVMIAPNENAYKQMKSSGCFGRELLSRPMIAREEGSGTDRSLMDYLRETGYPTEQLNIVARVNDPEAIKQMVSQGAGIAVISARAVEKEAREGSLLIFEIDSTPLRRNIYLAWRRDTAFAAGETEFMHFLKKECGAAGTLTPV